MSFGLPWVTGVQENGLLSTQSEKMEKNGEELGRMLLAGNQTLDASQ